MKTETKVFSGQALIELIFIVLTMTDVLLLSWGSLFLGTEMFVLTFVSCVMCVGIRVKLMHRSGHEFFFEPFFRRRPLLMAPTVGVTGLSLFLVIAYGVVCALF